MSREYCEIFQNSRFKAKKERKMKKLLITLSIMIAISLSANAQYFGNTQTDGFFYSEESQDYYRMGSASNDYNPVFPRIPDMGVYSDQDAPLGSGLLLLTGIGLVYALKRKKD